MYYTYNDFADLYDCYKYYDWTDDMDYETIYTFETMENEYTVMCHTRAAASAIREEYPECYYSMVAVAAGTGVQSWAQDWFIMWQC